MLLPKRNKRDAPRKCSLLTLTAYGMVLISGLTIVVNFRGAVNQQTDGFTSPLHRIAGVHRQTPDLLPRGVRVIVAATPPTSLTSASSQHAAQRTAGSIATLLHDVWGPSSDEANAVVAPAQTTGGNSDLVSNCTVIDPATASLASILCSRAPNRPFRVNPRSTFGNHKLAYEPDFELLSPSEDADAGLTLTPPITRLNTSNPSGIVAKRTAHERSAQLAIVVVTAPRMFAASRDARVRRYFRFQGECSTDGLLREG
jgi:hypothetical protein